MPSKSSVFQYSYYLNSFVIVHDPPIVFMTICKAMIMLSIIANLEFQKAQNNNVKIIESQKKNK